MYEIYFIYYLFYHYHVMFEFYHPYPLRTTSLIELLIIK